MAQVVQCLHSNHEALSLNPSTTQKQIKTKQNKTSWGYGSVEEGFHSMCEALSDSLATKQKEKKNIAQVLEVIKRLK
jgi:hypothetical protein